MSVKSAILKAKVENQIVELMVKSNVANVYLEDDNTTLAAKLAEIATTLDNKANSTDVTQEIANAIDGLIDGAPGTYDTLKEIADYIAAHEEVVTALNEAIGNKVNKEEGKGLSANDFTDVFLAKLNGIAEGAEVNQNAFSKFNVGGTVIDATDKTDTLGLVAGDNVTLTPDAAGKTVTVGVTIPEATVDAELNKTSENAVQNKAVATKFEEVDTALAGTPDVYIQASQPADLKENDLWLQIL